MIEYIEDRVGHFNANVINIPNDPANRHYQIMQAEVLAAEAFITPYVGSPEELNFLMGALTGGIHDKFQEITGTGILTAIAERDRYIDPNLVLLADFLDNITKAEAAVVLVSAYTTVAQVNGFDINNDIAWSL